ncbi:DUF6660 family protein [Pedobacter sp. L105]|uniref:DUF6660 family protein n=1 Tax=Pedobacter sp. L105 TaxID=1641871 RepID=UPI003529E7D3
MKYLALLISIYFTILAVLPCQDREDMSVNVVQVTFQKPQSTDQAHSQESCPPFCNCSCCSAARQLVAESSLVFFTHVTVFSYPEYAIPATQKQVIAIWQPPQFS